MSRGLGLTLDVTLSSDESYDVNGGSLTLTYENICEAITVECTGDVYIFSIAQISAESWVDLMFVD